MTYLIYLVLAVLWTLLLSGVNLASLHTLLHQDLLDGQENACSFAGEPFMGVTESRGGANTQLKQRVYALVGSFELPGSPFMVKMQGSRENM